MFHKTETQPINYIQILPRRGSSKTLVFWDAAFLNPVNDDSVIMLLKYSTQNSPLYSKRQRGKSSDTHMCYVNWLRIPKKHRASPNPLKSYVGELYVYRNLNTKFRESQSKTLYFLSVGFFTINIPRNLT